MTDMTEYLNSDNYKIVCILQIFREAGEITGTSFVSELERFKDENVNIQDINPYKLLLDIEYGFEPLSDLEVDSYIKYIAYQYQFNLGLFSKIIKEYATNICTTKVKETDGIQYRARIVHDIFEKLKMKKMGF